MVLTKKTTDPFIEKLQKIAGQIRENSKPLPDTRKQYHEAIDRLEAEAAQIAREKELVITEHELEELVQKEQMNREKLRFYQRKLREASMVMRMDESKYDSYTAEVRSIVEDAAADFQKVAGKAVEELINARRKYLSVVREADRTMEELDHVANVLQVKYRYKTINRVGMDPEQKDDPNEWTWHVVRYCQGLGKELATVDRLTMYNVAWYAGKKAEQLLKAQGNS